MHRIHTYTDVACMYVYDTYNTYIHALRGVPWRGRGAGAEFTCSTCFTGTALLVQKYLRGVPLRGRGAGARYFGPRVSPSGVSICTFVLEKYY